MLTNQLDRGSERQHLDAGRALSGAAAVGQSRGFEPDVDHGGIAGIAGSFLHPHDGFTAAAIKQGFVGADAAPLPEIALGCMDVGVSELIWLELLIKQ